MFEMAALHDQTTDLIARLSDACEGYARLVGSCPDECLRLQLEKLLREKQRHGLLAERLREIFE